jgi:hypothetical protein
MKHSVVNTNVEIYGRFQTILAQPYSTEGNDMK